MQIHVQPIESAEIGQVHRLPPQRGGVTGPALGAGAAGMAGCAMTGGAGDGVGAGVVGICASPVRAQKPSAAAMKVALIIIPSL